MFHFLKSNKFVFGFDTIQIGYLTPLLGSIG